MYKIYMEGLGRYGDLDGIQQIWMDLRRVTAVQEVYANEQGLGECLGIRQCDETGSDIHGRRRAWLRFRLSSLNQMIFHPLDTKHGPSVALDLYEQARAPTSAIPINITTLNIVLRHHAAWPISPP